MRFRLALAAAASLAATSLPAAVRYTLTSSYQTSSFVRPGFITVDTTVTAADFTSSTGTRSLTFCTQDTIGACPFSYSAGYDYVSTDLGGGNTGFTTFAANAFESYGLKQQLGGSGTLKVSLAPDPGYGVSYTFTSPYQTTTIVTGDFILADQTFTAAQFATSTGTRSLSFCTLDTIGACPFSYGAGYDYVSTDFGGGNTGFTTFAADAFESYGLKTALDNPASSLLVAQVRLTTGVPEPGSWAMMVAGFGAVGAALRRRRAPRYA